MPSVEGASRRAFGCRRGRPLTEGPRGYARRRGWRRWVAATSAEVRRGESGAVVGCHAPPPPPPPSRRSRRAVQRLVLAPLHGGRGEPGPSRWTLSFVTRRRRPGGHPRKPLTTWRRRQWLCAGERMGSSAASLPTLALPRRPKAEDPPDDGADRHAAARCVVVRVALGRCGNRMSPQRDDLVEPPRPPCSPTCPSFRTSRDNVAVAD